jgi:hypothetical protein
VDEGSQFSSCSGAIVRAHRESKLGCCARSCRGNRARAVFPERGKRKLQEAVCHVIGLTIFDRVTFFKERVKWTYCLTFVIGIVTDTAAELELEMTLGVCLWLKLKLKMAAITSPRATSTTVVKFSLQRSSILYNGTGGVYQQRKAILKNKSLPSKE